jgi:hypothetical protein
MTPEMVSASTLARRAKKAKTKAEAKRLLAQRRPAPPRGA